MFYNDEDNYILRLEITKKGALLTRGSMLGGQVVDEHWLSHQHLDSFGYPRRFKRLLKLR